RGYMVREPARRRTNRFPRRARVERDIEAAVVTVHHVAAVRWIDPDRVIVDVAHVVQPLLCLAAVSGLCWPDAAQIDGLAIVRIDAQLAEVRWPLILVRYERPRFGFVVRSPESRQLWIRRRRAATSTRGGSLSGLRRSGRRLLVGRDFYLSINGIRILA